RHRLGGLALVVGAEDRGHAHASELGDELFGSHGTEYAREERAGWADRRSKIEDRRSKIEERPAGWPPSSRLANFDRGRSPNSPRLQHSPLARPANYPWPCISSSSPIH